MPTVKGEESKLHGSGASKRQTSIPVYLPLIWVYLPVCVDVSTEKGVEGQVLAPGAVQRRVEGKEVGGRRSQLLVLTGGETQRRQCRCICIVFCCL